MMALAAPAHRAEIRFCSIPSLALPVAVARTARALRTSPGRADGILLDSIAAAVAAPWVGAARLPVVAIVHQAPGGVDHGRMRSWAQGGLDRLAYRRASGAIVTSGALVEDLRASGVPVERIRVVPPGCDVPRAAGPPLDLRRGRGAAVLCVANWTPSKGILELIEAFASLPEDAATLWLVGAHDADRAYAERVHRRISSLDLSRRVVVCGAMPIEEVERFYRSADVFALCSLVDAYGMAWAEAISAGLPVVGWRAANLPNLVEHGREGLTPEPGDRRGLAAALRTITADPAVRKRLAQGAKHRGATLPTWRLSAGLFFDTVREFVEASGSEVDRGSTRGLGGRFSPRGLGGGFVALHADDRFLPRRRRPIAAVFSHSAERC
jgi:glycosyltransferase involved in cell wall biosynthesis